MKKIISVSIFLFFQLNQSFADCDAPNLSFRKHTGHVHGFRIEKLWQTPEDPKMGPKDTKISFGDYTYLFMPADNQKTKPKKVSVDTETTDKLKASFKSSENYLEKEKQNFILGKVEGFDLNGDLKADVVLFEVSPGANVYSGAVGIINKEMLTLIQPVCF